MMPTFSGNERDAFTQSVPPRNFLLLDRVLEGRAPASSAPLLHLPVEILALIVQKIPDDCLAPFAFVNSDCRQLARSRQFANLLFDYSPKAVDIIERLLMEDEERRASG